MQSGPWSRSKFLALRAEQMPEQTDALPEELGPFQLGGVGFR